MTVPPDPTRPPASGARPRGSRWGRRNRSGGPGFPVVPTVIGVAVLGAAAWWWFGLRSPTAEPTNTPPAPAVAPAQPATSPSTAAPEPLDLPPLSESDGIVRDLVGTLSRHSRWAGWLVTDELAQRFVAAVASVAAGVSPATHVPFLAPEGRFRVRSRGEGKAVDPESYRRYDAITEAFVSVDTRAAVRLYQQLLPLFEEAHRTLGFPEGSFNATFAQAIDNVLDVEIPEVPPAVVLDVETYLFEDPGMEALTPVEKHVMRLGPDNGRRIQAKLRDLRNGLVAAGLVLRR